MESDPSSRKMAEDALFNLRWDAQRSALLGSMATLYREEAFVDTTIVADNKIYKAHKLLLSASSSYLKHILESVPSSQHAVLFMPHIGASDLGNVLKFIYEGEIKINKRSLKSFLAVARLLRIKGMDFELSEDLEVNISQVSTQPCISSPMSILNHNHKRNNSESCPDEVNASIPSSKSSSSSSTSTSQSHPRSTPTRDNANSTATIVTDDESKITRPALITSSGRSTDSLSSQTSHNLPSPSTDNQNQKQSSSTNNNHLQSHSDEIPATVSSQSADRDRTRNGSNGDRGRDGNEDSLQDDSNHSDMDNRKALDLHIGRYHPQHDSESLDMDHDSQHHDQGGMSIPDDMDDDYDDDDDDQNFSMSIQPEVSLRESDESYNVNDRRNPSIPDYKPINFSNSFCGLPMLSNSSMSITQTPGGNNGPLSAGNSPLSLQQHMTLKHLSKLARPVIPKREFPGQDSPQSQSGPISGINEGILMRMMREPLQGSNKPINNSSGHSGFFDIPHTDPNLHPAGIRKQKRYVQCTSCSKVLSSLSALKRHMEDVHCARIQGKCLLCGRVYSSRNSLLTHVYSAHKKHHDYKAVARIIRESDFEQFATA